MRCATGMQVALLVMLAACATTEVETLKAPAVAHNRDFVGGELQTGRPGKSTLIIKRDRGVQGLACYLRILVDEMPVADLDRGEKVVLHPDPGDHVLGVSPTSGVCGGGYAGATASLVAGQTATFRVGFGFGIGNVFLQGTDS